MGAEVGDAELAAPELLADVVCGADILHGSAEDGANGGGLVLHGRWKVGLWNNTINTDVYILRGEN